VGGRNSVGIHGMVRKGVARGGRRNTFFLGASCGAQRRPGRVEGVLRGVRLEGREGRHREGRSAGEEGGGGRGEEGGGGRTTTAPAFFLSFVFYSRISSRGFCCVVFHNHKPTAKTRTSAGLSVTLRTNPNFRFFWGLWTRNVRLRGD
jgi:hypothetical protein